MSHVGCGSQTKFDQKAALRETAMLVALCKGSVKQINALLMQNCS